MTLRVGVIGAGGMGSIHLDTLADREDVDMTAVCTHDRIKAETVADTHGAAGYTDHEELFASHDLDAVFVCVPPFAHGSPEHAAAEYGVDMFVEKPIALDSQTAREVHEAVADAGILTQVGYMLRYAEITEHARNLIGDRDTALIDGHWRGEVPGPSWWRERALSGGQVVEQSTHVYDLLRYLGGEIDRVVAEGGRRLVEALDFPDSTTAVLRHENGTVSQVASTATSPEHGVGVTAVGDGFALDLAFTSNTLSGRLEDDVIRHEGSGDAYAREVDAFLEAVSTGNEDLLRSPYADARQTLEVTLAVREAIDTDHSVAVPRVLE